MQSGHNPALDAHIRRIRHEIEEAGEAIVGEKELQAYAGGGTGRSQWDVIAKMAIAEGWTFTFFPNGSVRFAKLATDT